MSLGKIKVIHLYARDMNIYGDRGNVLCLKKRLELYGFTPEIVEYNQGDVFPGDGDIFVGGGGQDSGQNKIKTDLNKIGPKLIAKAKSGTPMLMICGLYQLFGNFFKTIDGQKIEGIGLLDIETYGRDERLIGNIIIHSQEFGDIIGYENHSGQTYLGRDVEALGRVRLGAGNNFEGVDEGARYRNVIGTYLHGSLLPKNPRIADFLIKTAVINKFGEDYFKPKKIDTYITEMARKTAMKRPR